MEGEMQTDIHWAASNDHANSARGVVRDGKLFWGTVKEEEVPAVVVLIPLFYDYMLYLHSSCFFSYLHFVIWL